MRSQISGKAKVHLNCLFMKFTVNGTLLMVIAEKNLCLISPSTFSFIMINSVPESDGVPGGPGIFRPVAIVFTFSLSLFSESLVSSKSFINGEIDRLRSVFRLKVGTHQEWADLAGWRRGFHIRNERLLRAKRLKTWRCWRIYLFSHAIPKLGCIALKLPKRLEMHSLNDY